MTTSGDLPLEINNHFGDMDLYLMDAILKGYIPKSGRVLDAGCGEGRNALYFIKGGYEYLGVDQDASKIKLFEFFTNSISGPQAKFLVQDIRSVSLKGDFSMIIASRLLHFCSNEEEFFSLIQQFFTVLIPGGVFYFSMDSAFSSEAKTREDGMSIFPDGRVSFALNESRYHYMLERFQEIESLKTVIHRHERSQSFGLLRKPY